MELGAKAIIGGAALFVLGGLSVYLLTSSTSSAVPSKPAATVTALYAAPAPTNSTTASDSSATNAESFYAAADARREQQLIDKAEADRLAKLKAIKERSVECKFWKQQNKTTSASAKIDEKIDEHCNLPISSSARSEHSSSDSSEKNTSNNAG